LIKHEWSYSLAYHQGYLYQRVLGQAVGITPQRKPVENRGKAFVAGNARDFFGFARCHAFVLKTAPG
jgi:hypothetical protein